MDHRWSARLPKRGQGEGAWSGSARDRSVPVGGSGELRGRVRGPGVARRGVDRRRAAGPANCGQGEGMPGLPRRKSIIAAGGCTEKLSRVGRVSRYTPRTGRASVIDRARQGGQERARRRRAREPPPRPRVRAGSNTIEPPRLSPRASHSCSPRSSKPSTPASSRSLSVGSTTAAWTAWKPWSACSSGTSVERAIKGSSLLPEVQRLGRADPVDDPPHHPGARRPAARARILEKVRSAPAEPASSAKKGCGQDTPESRNSALLKRLEAAQRPRLLVYGQ